MIENNNNFCLYILMVFDSHVHFCSISTFFIQRLSLFIILFSNYIKSVACYNRDILVFRSMINTILTNKLQGSIFFIFFEYSYCPFRERNSKTIFLYILEIKFVLNFKISLRITIAVNSYLMIFSDR